MGKIFAGCIFILLNFDLNLGNITIGLIPSFIGFFLLASGLREVCGDEKNESFQRIVPFAFGMGSYSAVIYVMCLTGLGGADRMSVLFWILGITGQIVQLYILYRLIWGIRQIENGHDVDMYSGKLMSVWCWMAGLQCMTALIGIFQMLGLLAIFVIIAAFAVCLMFLYYIYKAKEVYYGKVIK